MICLLLIFLPSIILAENGIAELKALTGDRPYLGWGNQEQAPEYFGSAMQRQIMHNPAYYPRGSSYGGGDVFGNMFGAGYRSPWRSYGGGSGYPFGSGFG